MKIINGSCHQVWNLQTDSDEWKSHIRYDSDDWYIRIGISYWSISDCDDLEAAFQEYLKIFDITKA